MNLSDISSTFPPEQIVMEMVQIQLANLIFNPYITHLEILKILKFIAVPYLLMVKNLLISTINNTKKEIRRRAISSIKSPLS
jgi:hypothetical protein